MTLLLRSFSAGNGPPGVPTRLPGRNRDSRQDGLRSSHDEAPL